MDLEAEIGCPNCKRKLKIKVKEMVPGREKTCRYCNAVIHFTGDDGRKAQRAMDDLEKTLKNLFR